MKVYQSIICIFILAMLIFPFASQVRANGIRLSNAALTVDIDSYGFPRYITTARVPTQSISEPTTEFLFYGGAWHALPLPSSIVQTSATSYEATYVMEGFNISVKGELKTYPALVMTFYVKNTMESSSTIGFQFSVDYNNPSHLISPWNVIEPIFVQSSSIPLSWTNLVPSRYNGSNIIITAEDAKSWCFQSISTTVGKTAVVAGPWSSIHYDPSLSAGMVHISTGDNAYGVQLLDAPIAAGVTISYKVAMGMDVARGVAFKWGLISVK
jgi:hypothetical protein